MAQFKQESENYLSVAVDNCTHSFFYQIRSLWSDRKGRCLASPW